MLRGLILLCSISCFLLLGCGERLKSLKIITSDLFNNQSNFEFDENYSYIKLQVNSNDFSYLALGYVDLDTDGEPISVWYSSDKHVLRIKQGRLYSISSVSPLWYGQKYVTKPNKFFSNSDSFQRIRFGNKAVNIEVNEIVSIINRKVPLSFKKFCNLGEKSLWVSEIAVDQYGNKLKSYYGFLDDGDNKIQCVYQQLDDKNIIKWIHI